MMNDSTIYMGLDAHKESIVAAYSIGFGEVQGLGNVGVCARDLDRLCTRMQSKASQVVFVYEAGPCGYGLYRYLTKKGFDCMVCAPSLIARKPGDRVKTDRRDAITLVKALRMGDLTRVHVPDIADEALRDLVRAWSAAKQDLRPGAATLEVVPADARCALCRYRQLGSGAPALAVGVHVSAAVVAARVRGTPARDRRASDALRTAGDSAA